MGKQLEAAEKEQKDYDTTRAAKEDEYKKTRDAKLQAAAIRRDEIERTAQEKKRLEAAYQNYSKGAAAESDATKKKEKEELAPKAKADKAAKETKLHAAAALAAQKAKEEEDHLKQETDAAVAEAKKARTALETAGKAAQQRCAKELQTAKGSASTFTAADVTKALKSSREDAVADVFDSCMDEALSKIDIFDEEDKKAQIEALQPKCE